MAMNQDAARVLTVGSFTIRDITTDDLKAALKAGISDFTKKPLMGMFFGGVYAVCGLAIFVGLFVYGAPWLIIPIAIGFPLIAPFAAAGLYEISRRLSQNESISWSQVMGVIWRQQRREMGWMAFVVLFVFWVWSYQVRLLLAIFLGESSIASLGGLGSIILTTPEGFSFIAVGTISGAALSTILFSITVIAMPLLLERDLDFVSAMILSVKTVLGQPLTMLSWGAFIALVLIVSMIPAFIGILVTLPVLGHATWHLYKRMIEVDAT